MQLRKQLSEALEKQQKSEHERAETETKVMEVSGGMGGGRVLLIHGSQHSFILQSRLLPECTLWD